MYVIGADLGDFARDLRVAVDGGLVVYRKAGWKPHFAVGDWDSLKVKTALKGIYHLTLPQNKDRSDLYYACRAALSADATELVCLGVTGGRPDHQLATLLDLSELSSESGPHHRIIAIDSEAQYFFLSETNPEWQATLHSGQLVSVFALGTPATGVTLNGFRFPLRNARLQPSSHGLSNRVVKSQCSIKIKAGRVLVIVFNQIPRES